MGNQVAKDDQNFQIPNPIKSIPEIEFTSSNVGIPKLTPNFASFTFPEINSAYSSVSTEIPKLSSVKIPSISAIQQKTKEIRTNIGKDFEIGISATLVDINGLINDIGPIDNQLHLQNYAAGADLLNRYQQNLAIISDRNKYIQKKAALSSEHINKITALSISIHNDWNHLCTQLQGIPTLVENLNQAKSRLNKLIQKLKQTESVLTEATLNVLNIPFQKIKDEQTKQLESLKYHHKLQIVNLANYLEQKRQDEISQKNIHRANQIQRDGQKEMIKLSQKKILLLNKFEQQKEDFEIYGTVRTASASLIKKSNEVSKLEDVKIELNSDDLDNFLSSKIIQNNQEEIDQREEEPTATEKIMSYLDDEEPDWK